MNSRAAVVVVLLLVLCGLASAILHRQSAVNTAPTPAPTPDRTLVLSARSSPNLLGSNSAPSGMERRLFDAQGNPIPDTAFKARQKPAADPAADASATNVPGVPAVVDEPLARSALYLVGMDPDAEAVWAKAINDPNMSPHDRQNLIEDLNETGFPNPDHPTADDLPLIENRLLLIEDAAVVTMDDVNLKAFQEAYKDLQNMYRKVSAQRN